VDWLVTRCESYGTKVLVLDTWTALSPGADPLGTADQTALAEIVKGIQERIGADSLIIVVDHSRKNRPEGQVLSSADIFGPPQKWAAAEHVVMQDVVKANERIEVFVESKDGDTARFFLDVSPRESGIEKFTWAGTVEDLAQQSRETGDKNREAVLAA